MITQPLFINSFQKGKEENANIGFGAFVGIETYSKKGVAQLSKDSTKVSGSVVTDLPVYFTSHTSQDIFCQGNSGKVYRSIDTGTTWTDISPASLTGGGHGLIFYQGYLFGFRGTAIDYCVSPYGSGNWTQNWKTGLNNNEHFPFLYPNDDAVYFANGNLVGKIGFGTSPTFNPAGSSGTDYFYDASKLALPNIYQINCISFLGDSLLALGTSSSGIGGSSQISDIILFNPDLNFFQAPLRLFSQAGLGLGGVNQIINRNNVLYAVTGGNHSIFGTNGTSFWLVDDISINTTARFITNSSGATGTGNTNGIQATAPIFLNQYPSAIAVFGNKLMTGVSSSISSLPSGYGLFPLGVWSEAFLNDKDTALQCEFTISSNVICSNSFSTGALYPVPQAQMLIGWFDGTNYGIDKTEYQNFQNDDSVVWIESEMFEIGTPLEPAVITTIQENIVRSLITGQTISVYWRSAYDQAYTLLETFDATDGDVQLNNSLKTVVNTMGAVKFLQLRISMATGGSNLAWSPELRNIIITGK